MQDVKMLSADQRKELMSQLQKQQKEEKQKRKEDIKAFKTLSAEFVNKHIDGLVTRQADLATLVNDLFIDYKHILSLKENIYGAKTQDSHTSTLADGSASVTIGYNVSIKFDGTEDAGVALIKEYIASLAGSNDDNINKLTKIVNVSLKRNAKTGMLNPSKIIDLNSLRDEFDSEMFDKGMDIIEAAQIRTQNSMYVSGWKYIPVDGLTKKVEFRFTV